MKFFIDTANLEQIQEAYDLGVLDGVTTNPSLMAKEGIKGTENQREHYIKICKIVNADVSAEVIATDYEGMIREGEELAALNPHIVVKVPCIADGIKAIKYFTEKGIRTNCTLVFSVGQALLAAKAGATYVSPFVGRLDDICEDGVGLVGDIVHMYRTYDYKTQVLAASIRNTKHIIECVEMGADVAKIAVMPQSREDVMTLMEATMEADHSLDIPVVTMSMGRLGVLSRLAGTLTGSAMTFASVGEASAPGQIPIEQMRVFCQLLSMK